VSENSKAAQLGFRSGDLIQQINGSNIKNIQNMKEYLEKSSTEKTSQHIFRVIRNQQSLAITIAQPLQEIVVVGK
jgi:S1-C subfamily serine protease